MTTEREDVEELPRSAESEELRVRELNVVRAGATIGRILIDWWHLPPEAVDGFLDNIRRHFKVFGGSMTKPEQWALERIVRLAREYMDSRGIAPAADEPESPPHILDVIRTQEALDSLPPNAAQAFVLWLKGYSRKQIAKELDVTQRYVRQLIDVAVDRLRAWRPRREE